MDCSHCGENVNFKMKFCPNCGTAVPRPTQEDLEKTKASLDSIRNKMTSGLDFSEAGIKSAQEYVVLVTDNIIHFGKLLIAFNETHQQAMGNKRLFKNQEWQMNTKMLVVGLALKSGSLSTTVVGTDVDLINYPPGCFPIANELVTIRKYAELFMESYSEFLSTGKQRDLENAGDHLQKVSLRIDSALDEIEKVSSQLTRHKSN